MSAPPPAANLPANVRVATVPPPTRTDVTGVSPTAGAPMFLGAVLLTVPLLLATVAIAVLALR